MSALINIFDTILTVFKTIIYKLATFWHQQFKVRKLKTVIHSSSNECFISIPIFKSNILKKNRDIVILEEVCLAQDIICLLQRLNISCFLTPAHNFTGTKISIGGPVSNEETNYYVVSRLHFLKWIVTTAHLNRYKTDPHLALMNFSYLEVSKDGKEGFKIYNDFYEYIPSKKGWAIITKLIETIDGNPRTVHLLFGCGANGTKGAVTYFVQHYSEIYAEQKRQDYFGIFEVDGKGNWVGKIKWYTLPLL